MCVVVISHLMAAHMVHFWGILRDIRRIKLLRYFEIVAMISALKNCLDLLFQIIVSQLQLASSYVIMVLC